MIRTSKIIVLSCAITILGAVSLSAVPRTDNPFCPGYACPTGGGASCGSLHTAQQMCEEAGCGESHYAYCSSFAPCDYVGGTGAICI